MDTTEIKGETVRQCFAQNPNVTFTHKENQGIEAHFTLPRLIVLSFPRSTADYIVLVTECPS